MDRLGEPDADRGLVAEPSSRVRTSTVSGSGSRPTAATKRRRVLPSRHAGPPRSILILIDAEDAAARRHEQVRASAPTRCRCVSRIEPYVPGTAVASCSGVSRDTHPATSASPRRGVRMRHREGISSWTHRSKHHRRAESSTATHGDDVRASPHGRRDRPGTGRPVSCRPRAPSPRNFHCQIWSE